MRLTTWAVLTVAGLAGFSLAQDMPKCATDCLMKGLDDSKCEATDFECICADDTLMGFVETCSMGACTVIEGLSAKNQTATLCKEPVRDRSLTAPIATAISAAFAIAFVALRLYEAYVRQEWQWADLCAVVALMSSIPMDVFEFFMMSEGFGKDTWTLEPKAITNVVKYTWITQVTYIPAIILTKVAIVLLYMRVFPGRTFRNICIGTVIYCSLFMTATTIAAVLACIPVEDAWRNWAGDTGGLCYDNSAFWWSHSALNIAIDLWIIALPIPKLWNLQLGVKKKIYLICMFSVGIIITVISVIRFSGLIQYSATTNPAYNNVMVATYSVVECNVSIMCCCMPALYSFFRRVFPNIFGGSTNRSGYKTGSYNFAKSPMPSNAIQKTVEHQVSYIPRAGDSDVVELMDMDEGKASKKYNRW